jgi:hypothetical protein
MSAMMRIRTDFQPKKLAREFIAAEKMEDLTTLRTSEGVNPLL